MVKTGKIAELIQLAKDESGQQNVVDIPAESLLQILCEYMKIDAIMLDNMIAENPPVFRSIKGHAFETVFHEIIKSTGNLYEEVGGDNAVDGIVNKHTLQLKTPTAAGSRGNIVQYKTHKTHGAKSELESLDYYHNITHFADFLVGLISYDPLRIIFLNQEELPRHTLDNKYIISPFKINFEKHPGLNSFSRIGVHNVPNKESFISKVSGLLPKSEEKLGLNASIILHTIFKTENFRIWDMLMRGFIREIAFDKTLKDRSINSVVPLATGRQRADKADFALLDSSKDHKFFQVKGPSVSACNFDGENSVIAIETQLTRGRVNDHPTQSRLYQVSDFDYLLFGLDPCIGRMCEKQDKELRWRFYAIPSEYVQKHPKYTSHYKSMQKWTYRNLEAFLITEDWYNQWPKSS